jgi:hypothetical protein
MSPACPDAVQERCQRESDRIQQFFIRPFFLSATIGIPFSTYKFLFGLALVRSASLPGSIPALAGWLVIGWAGADLIMNAGRAVLDLTGRDAPFEYCMIAQLGRIAGMPMVFLALDTLLSFAIICFMLWSGWIATLTTAESFLWNGATTLNLLSLSVVLLYNEIKKAGNQRSS